MPLSPKWPSKQKMIREAQKRGPRSLKTAIAYNLREDGDINKVNSFPALTYNGAGHTKAVVAIGDAMAGEDWLPKLSESVAYSIFGAKLQFYWCRQFRLLFPDHEKPIRPMPWSSMAEMMAFAFILGWRDEGIYLGHLTFAALNLNYQLIISYHDEHKRGQAFMLRLFSAWRGGMSHDWPDFAYDEPIYENLLRQWDEPDPAKLIPLLEDACDRHTFQSQEETDTKFFDFSEYPRMPLEILLLFRLRELSKLSNPVMHHPLMDPPFNKLPEPQPLFTPDEIMQATYRRAREDWPDFDEITSLRSVLGYRLDAAAH